MVFNEILFSPIVIAATNISLPTVNGQEKEWSKLYKSLFHWCENELVAQFIQVEVYRATVCTSSVVE